MIMDNIATVPDEILSSISRNLINYIETHKMKQKEFAAYTGILEASISHYIRKNRAPSLGALLVLADKMGMTVSELIGEQPIQKAEAKPEPCKVVRVVDGDTIIVHYDGEDVRVRLIGIDTPESVHPDPSKNIPEGTTASDYTKVLLDGQSVYLAFDKQKYDRYNRLLAYVYLMDSTFLNAHLLEVGMANVATFPPNVAHLELFESIEKARG